MRTFKTHLRVKSGDPEKICFVDTSSGFHVRTNLSEVWKAMDLISRDGRITVRELATHMGIRYQRARNIRKLLEQHLLKARSKTNACTMYPLFYIEDKVTVTYIKKGE